MSTVADLLDRLYRLILEPPDAQPASTRLAAGVSDVDTTFTLRTFDIPEDENLVRLGSILEIENELVRVTNFDATAVVVTVLREQLGTKAVAHDADATVKLSPPFPRLDAFNAVRDNIIALYPDLWTVKTEVLAATGSDVYPFGDPLGVEIVEANPDNTGWGTIKLDARIVDNHPRVGGRAVVTNINAVTTLWVRYRRRMDEATDESDTLEDLGVEEVWAQLVVISAAADLLAGRDIPASSVEWVQSVLQAENIRVGTRMSIAGGLSQYRDILLERFKKEMRAEDSNRIQISMTDAFAQL